MPKRNHIIIVIFCMFLLHATPICCAPRTVDWNKVNNRWRGAEYYPDDPPGWEGKISSQDIRKIRKVGISINKFAFDVYSQMANDIKGNILFSPYNLVMTLMEEYDRANRQTKDRLEKILYLDKDTKENLKLLAEIVNNTTEDSGKFYSSAEKTYFMSDWEFPFYIYENFMKHLEDRFSKVDFYKNEIEKCRVGMMTQSQRVKYYEDCDIKSFEFPFIDRYYSYIIILPKEKWNVRHIERTLSFEKYTLLALKQSDKNLHVRIVDTRISSSYDFSYLLEDSRKKRGEGKKIRQTNIFKLYGSEPSRAIPTLWHEPMNGGKFEMFPLGDIEHFPRIDRFKVDYDFKPEHPFLYFVVDNRSGAILLMGRYCGREQNENILSW